MTAVVVFALRIGLAVVVYIFLWWVLQTVWQEFKQQGYILSSKKKPGIHVDAKTENGEDYAYHFWQTEVSIGRGTHCDVAIPDEALSVNHARISFHHSQWWLEDIGSTNGTFLNKDQIITPTVIITGDKFKCGNTTFILRVDSPNNISSTIPQNEVGGPK